MKNRQIAALFLCGIMSLSLLAGCASNTADADNSQNDNTQTTEDGIKALYLSEQGIFSAGGITVTSDGTFDPENQWEETGAGQTAHVDHANVLYQIPAEETGLPMVFLHGYGQSRMGWMTTPDGREGWSEMFLRKGHGVFSSLTSPTAAKQVQPPSAVTSVPRRWISAGTLSSALAAGRMVSPLSTKALSSPTMPLPWINSSAR